MREGPVALATAELGCGWGALTLFEYLRNWPELLGRIASRLKPDGRLFLHVFSRRDVSYPCVARDESDWMARRFFSGGLMPPAISFSAFPSTSSWRSGGA
jgi:cyclopropane-fatty-acyl-phospholipid synthase